MRRRIMNTSVGQRVKQPVQRALGQRGWEVRRLDGSNDQSSLPDLIARKGVRCVLDVGANVGQFATRLRLAGYEGQILSLEPGQHAFRRLKHAARHDARWACVQIGAGAVSEALTLHVSENSTSSSVLPMTARHLDAAPESAEHSSSVVRIEPLDEVMKQSKLDGPFLLKLDVQGYELRALQGAQALLAQTPVIVVELSFVELFEGAPSYLDVLAFLHDKGYRPVGVESGFRDPRSGETLQCDVTLIRAV